MELYLSFGGLVFKFEYNCDLIINEKVKGFILESDNYDVYVNIRKDYDSIKLPSSNYLLNRDDIHEYYKYNDINYCLAIGRGEHYLSAAIYEDINNISFYLNDEPFEFPVNDIMSILRLLPINTVFVKNKRVFLHSSQVCYNNKQIVFTGPSGIGKTTQSKLWEKYKNAKITGNDRTIITKDNNRYKTYGFLIDGSSPVRSNESYELAVIVVLEKSLDNKIERLNASKAISSLMSQIILSDYTIENKESIMNMIIDIYQNVPIYKLSCTKDESAIRCLYDKLLSDGVIELEEC